MTTLNLRALVPGDEVAWRVLWEQYLTFYKSALPEEVYATTFGRLVDVAERGMFGLIAYLGDTPVGIVNCVIHRHLWRIEEVCYLGDLYVAPEARGSGLGRALIEAVYKEADARGAPSVYWMTQDHNQTARQLYDRVGELTPFIKYQRSAA